MYIYNDLKVGLCLLALPNWVAHQAQNDFTGQMSNTFIYSSIFFFLQPMIIDIFQAALATFFCKRTRPNLGCTYHIYGRQIHFTNNFLTGHILSAAQSTICKKMRLKFKAAVVLQRSKLACANTALPGLKKIWKIG